jgi:hypothetical protein
MGGVANYGIRMIVGVGVGRCCVDHRAGTTSLRQEISIAERRKLVAAHPSHAATEGRRKEREKCGPDLDQWFDNVELVPAEQIGIETTIYLRNSFSTTRRTSLRPMRGTPPRR